MLNAIMEKEMPCFLYKSYIDQNDKLSYTCSFHKTSIQYLFHNILIHEILIQQKLGLYRMLNILSPAENNLVCKLFYFVTLANMFQVLVI